MPMTTEKTILAIIVLAAVTYALRFAPALIFSGRETPRVIVYLGKVLPYAIIGMLVIYGYKDTTFTEIGNWLPGLIAAAVIVLSYLWKRNTLISVVGGTLIYMLLVQLVF